MNINFRRRRRHHGSRRLSSTVISLVAIIPATSLLLQFTEWEPPVSLALIVLLHFVMIRLLRDGARYRHETASEWAGRLFLAAFVIAAAFGWYHLSLNGLSTVSSEATPTPTPTASEAEIWFPPQPADSASPTTAPEPAAATAPAMAEDASQDAQPSTSLLPNGRGRNVAPNGDAPAATDSITAGEPASVARFWQDTLAMEPAAIVCWVLAFGYGVAIASLTQRNGRRRDDDEDDYYDDDDYR